jgi:malate dehydrogenase
MHQVAIIGAGEVGGLLAHALARRHVASDIVLIDDNERAAQGKALDIAQAAPIEGFASRVSGTADTAVAAGAAIVALADPFGAAALAGEAALLVLKRLRQFAPRTLIVCADASHRELVERGVRELHMDRTRLIGSAPEALVAGVRALVAIETGNLPRDVTLTAIGVPPHHIVVPWEDATIGGFGLTRVLSEPEKRRLDSRVTALWPPGPYALAAAAAKTIDAVLKRSEGLMACFVAPDDSAGLRTRAAALPVRLGDTGVIEVVLPEMSVRERVQLDNAMLL